MKITILCKYGEISLKGLNRIYFENLLKSRIKKLVKPYGNFSVYALQSTLYIEPLDDDCDCESAYYQAKNTFGIAAVVRAYQTEKNMESIKKIVNQYIAPYLSNKSSFKVESKRSDKKFPLNSLEISKEVGGYILEALDGKIDVDVHNPESIIRVEIRDRAAYVCTDQERAIGGMPVGSNGRGLVLISGGLDSPVAAFTMAKRGVTLDALHFESFPYTSERARDKVCDLLRIVSRYSGPIKMYVISLTTIQEAIRDNCDEDYFTLLLRRIMMRLADRTSEKLGCGAIITGESLGQVASQTMEAIGVTNCLANRPVFRPLIGTDKDDIVKIAREIGTFETSILPYEDCCTVFTPRHPRTKPELKKVEKEEARIPNLKELEDEAYNSMYVIDIQ